MRLHELSAGVDEGLVATTVDAIAAVQLGDGCIPWFSGHHVDPWNHVEAAMALSAGGRVAEAERAYRWLAALQRRDGTWFAYYRDGKVTDPTVDANFCAYIATGLWHHTQATGDATLLARLWPVVERAIDAVLTLQTPGGEILWARDAKRRPYPAALLTSSSSIHFSLRCAVSAAAELGADRDDWENAARRLAHAIAHRSDRFEPRDRWAMDWYYPVLGGAVTGQAALVRLAERWDEFVVDGLGVRCVSDRPWVTGAETCELVLALDATGRIDDAWRLFTWMQRLRGDDGAYWTGDVFPDNIRWPEEQTTWTSAATVLAADALLGLSPAAGFFRTLHLGDTEIEAAG
ncbi:MAG TPA: prenyltransferase [Candidatus Dormibacteraeota bacterium]|jgi:hypothetical protein|nr:prenyltransferase [Candidatus Dormibacteraeota bacterium]